MLLLEVEHRPRVADARARQRAAYWRELLRSGEETDEKTDEMMRKVRKIESHERSVVGALKDNALEQIRKEMAMVDRSESGSVAHQRARAKIRSEVDSGRWGL